MDDKLMVVAKESGLEKTQVETLLSNFGDAYQKAREIAVGANELIVTDESETELMAEARTKRLALKNIRIDVENTRKRLKEQSLREGKAIDGMANIIKALVVPVEEHLEMQEKFADLKKSERRAQRLAERTKRLAAYTDNTDLYNLELMEDEAFERLLTDTKAAHDAKIAAEAAAEKERQEKAEAEAKEQARIREENAKLKAESEKREAEIERERAEAEKQRKIELEKAEAERKADREAAEKKAAAERAEAEKKLEAERRARAAEQEKREKLEREQKERDAAEARRKAAEEEKQRQDLLAPDKQKLMAFATVIDNIELPHVSNREAGKLLDETQDFLARISKNLRNKAQEL